MAELLDFNGVWDTAMIELMFPVALELEARAMRQSYEATTAAACNLLTREPSKAFLESLDAVDDEVEKFQLLARGVKPTAREKFEGTAADKMLKIFKKMGLDPLANRKGKKGKRTSAPTKVHRG